jgi:glyoxylase-like metal-dependent hydrolase (beta-lactamase superfamily II)
MADTKVYALNVADWTNDYSMLQQLSDFGEPYAVKCPAYLVDHPEGTLLFDTGPSWEMKQNPADYGPNGAAHMEAHVDNIDMTEDDHITNQLDDLGYSPSEIDYVAMSHLHVDHAGGISDFPDSEFLIRQEELQYAWWPRNPIQQAFYVEGDFTKLRDPDYSVTEVEGEDDFDVFGDGSVVLFPTQGHTAGHQSMEVDLGDRSVILAADISHTWEGYETELLASFNWDNNKAVESLRKLKARARDEDTEVYNSHDRERWEELPDPPNALD